MDEGARRPRGSTRRGGCRSAECSTRGHLKSPAAAFKGNPGPGSLCGAAGRRRSGTAGGAMPARPLSRWLRREPCGPGHGEGARRAQPTGRCGSPDSRPGQVGASGVRRPPRAGVGGGGWGGPGGAARRARETGLGSPAARAGRRRRSTKMSAGEKINPCVAAAALPLHSSPALSSLPPSPAPRGGGGGAGGASFLKRPHQALARPLSRQRCRAPAVHGSRGARAARGGIRTAALGLRTNIPL